MLITTPIELRRGSYVASVPEIGGITLDKPAQTEGKFFALLSYEIYVGYHIHKLVQVTTTEQFAR